MTRRATPGGKVGKARRRNSKRRRTGHLGSASILQKQLRERAHELAETRKQLAEALEQQTATNQILGVISRSPTNLQPVFDAIVANAAHLCHASNASVYRVVGDKMYHVANYGGVGIVGPGESRPITDGSLSGKAVIGRKIIHLHDALAVVDELPDSRDAIKRENIRTSLAIPLMRGHVLLGVFVARRDVVRDFTDKQIALLKTFAITSYALSGDEQRARAAGCDDYVPKPYSPRQLLAKINQYLS